LQFIAVEKEVGGFESYRSGNVAGRGLPGEREAPLLLTLTDPLDE